MTKAEQAKHTIGEDMVIQRKLKPILRPPPPFPKRLNKKNGEGKFKNIISILT